MVSGVMVSNNRSVVSSCGCGERIMMLMVSDGG